MSLLPCISIADIIHTYKQQLQLENSYFTNDFGYQCHNVDDSFNSYSVRPKQFLTHCTDSEKRLIALSKKIKKDDYISALQSSARIAKYLQLPIRTPTVHESVQQMLTMKKKLLNYEKICKMFTNIVKLETFKLIEKQDKIRFVCDTSPRPRGTAKQIHCNAQNSFQSKDFTAVSDDSILRVYFFDPIRGSRIAGFDILGSQTLADLKDSFVCLSNSRSYS